MSSFGNFYLSGGLHNHLVTIAFGVAVASLIFARRGDRPTRWLDTSSRALVACLGLGALGTAQGIIEIGAAVATVKPEMAALAATRGFGVAIIPLVWSLMCVLPLWIVSAVARHRIAS